MKEFKPPKHQMSGLMTVDGYMWCEVCDKWHLVLNKKVTAVKVKQ